MTILMTGITGSVSRAVLGSLSGTTPDFTDVMGRPAHDIGEFVHANLSHLRGE